MNEELDVLKLVCHRLESGGVAYMVTGSVAANLYAAPRMTRDIDIVVDLKLEGVNSFHSLFKDDFYTDLDTIRAETKRRRMFNVIHDEHGIKIDFVVLKEEEYRQTEFARRQRIRLSDMELFVTSPEDLVLSKLIWARQSFSELQLKDVKKLLSATSGMDQRYLQEWIARLSLEDVYQKALE